MQILKVVFSTTSPEFQKNGIAHQSAEILRNLANQVELIDNDSFLDADVIEIKDLAGDVIGELITNY